LLLCKLNSFSKRKIVDSHTMKMWIKIQPMLLMLWWCCIYFPLSVEGI